MLRNAEEKKEVFQAFCLLVNGAQGSLLFAEGSLSVQRGGGGGSSEAWRARTEARGWLQVSIEKVGSTVRRLSRGEERAACGSVEEKSCDLLSLR